MQDMNGTKMEKPSEIGVREVNPGNRQEADQSRDGGCLGGRFQLEGGFRPGGAKEGSGDAHTEGECNKFCAAGGLDGGLRKGGKEWELWRPGLARGLF